MFDISVELLVLMPAPVCIAADVIFVLLTKKRPFMMPSVFYELLVKPEDRKT